jgi:hypothetical protein
MVGTLPMRVVMDGFTKAKSVRLIENQNLSFTTGLTLASYGAVT